MISQKKTLRKFDKSVKQAKGEVLKARSWQKIVQRKFDEVEDLLNEYAYYNPEGYRELHEYKNFRNEPINVYVMIDDSMEIINSTDSVSYGEYGALDVDSVDKFTEDNSFANSSTDEYGESTFLIRLAPNNFAITIPHEKGHFDSMYEDYAKDSAFYVANKNKPKAGKRHLDGDPSGERAYEEEKEYKASKKAIVKEKGYFDKHKHKREY
jgi:hypothetical protein